MASLVLQLNFVFKENEKIAEDKYILNIIEELGYRMRYMIYNHHQMNKLVKF